jgi:site-specific DNA-cytosine methylase
VQEQATEIWKLTAEEQSRLAEEGTLQVLSTSFVDDLVRLFSGWKDRFTDEEWQWLEHNVFQMAEILTAISADEGDADKFLSDITPVVLRIRKLTPRECFRLMDMDDKYIDIIQNETTISNSNQYKLAGNSIVVSCLYYLFENLIYPPEEPQGDKYGQLSLF